MPRLELALATWLVAACSTGEPQRPTHGVSLIEAVATTEIAAAVRAELAAAAQAGDRLVVYVGATWCEPCRRFHDAAARGELDLQFGGTRFLVFDRDRDHVALDAAGYTSRMIPLFAIPAPDGTATPSKIEGSIKGDGAVGQIAPRLRALLDAPR